MSLMSTFPKSKGLWRQHSVIPLLLSLSLFLGGCTYILPNEMTHRGEGRDSGSEVDWMSGSEVHNDLISLPAPKGKMTISVYNFRDQSGQYLPQPSNAFSTAVPQGTLPMLMSALRTSGWFDLVEREGLQNLLTERKILRARQDDRGDKRPIKALSPANIIIEGGVLAYDSNIRTGGAGAKYVGIGASGQYREDQVTVGLRAVDVNTGRIFNSVSVTKRLLSTQVSSNVFRFVRYKKLLEVETGVTETDPAQVVVMDAIEAAVIKLVVSGVISNHWSLKYEQDDHHPVIAKYAEAIDYAKWKQDRFNRRANRDKASVAMNTADSVAVSSIGNSPGKKPPQGSKTVRASSKPGKGSKAAKKARKKSAKRSFKPIDTVNSASLNRGMKKADNTEKKRQSQQSMTLNRARGENAAKSKGDLYTIQLYAGATDDALVHFLSEYPSLSGYVWQTQQYYQGKVWYTVVYGKYPHRHEANKAMKELPLHVKDLAPWIRTLFVNN